MAKFIIECPSCGKYVQASKGLFARSKIRCSCGENIVVRSNRMMSRTCPHCGNVVVFDATKGDKARCPVCKEPINTLEETAKTEEFSCCQCGIRLRASKSAATYRCPVCDAVNDVQAQIAKEKIARSGAASVIKYEGDNETFIWKHPIEDFNLGSQLIVHESQEAIFFRDGQALDSLGPGRHTLETQSIPIIGKLYKLPTQDQKVFHAEVYFVNLTTQMGIKWGTDTRVRVKDPINNFYVLLGAGGEFNLKVAEPRKLLLKLVGTANGLKQSDVLSNGKGFFRAMIMTNVKSFLAQIITQERINILDIDSELPRLSEGLRVVIDQAMREYGLTVPQFYVSRVLTPTPEEDPNFAELQQQFADRVLKIREEQIRKERAQAEQDRKLVEAQTEAKLKILSAQADAAAKRANIEVEAEEMKLKGYSYQQETAREVGLNATSHMGGGDGGSGLGDLMGLGVAIGTLGSVTNVTKEALSGIGTGVSGSAPAANTWQCVCGATNTGKFCSECGEPKPAAPGSWRCSCGAVNTGKFCSECGKPKPAAPGTWQCACGAVNTGKFCSECGAARPDGTWTCPNCGTSGITGKFCPECGQQKGE